MEDPESSKKTTLLENKTTNIDTPQNYTYHIIVLIIVVILILVCFSSTNLNSIIVGGALLSQSQSSRYKTYGSKHTIPGPSCLKSFSIVPFKKRKTVSFNMRKNKTCVFGKRDKPTDIKKKSAKYRKQ